MIQDRRGDVPSGSPTTARLDALLALCRPFGGSRREDLLRGSLDLLFGASGCTRGAAYCVHDGELRLVADGKLPEALREVLSRLPLAGPPLMIMQQAVQSRTIVAGHRIAVSSDAPPGLEALTAAGWEQIVACPISVGRELLGAMVVARPQADGPDEALHHVVEIACHVIALQIARARSERRSNSSEPQTDALAEGRMRALEHRLELPLAEIERSLKRQKELIGLLQAHGLERSAGEFAELTGVCKDAIRRARDAHHSLLAAIALRDGDHGGLDQSSVLPMPHEVPASPVAATRPPLVRHDSGIMPTARAALTPAVRSAAVAALRRDGIGSALELLRCSGAVAHSPSSTRVDATAPGPRGSVMVVDDDADIRALLRDLLEDEGYTVFTARDGQEALDGIRGGRRPDVVVLDLMMPVMDGWQFLDAAKHDALLAPIPIVVISAQTNEFHGPADAFVKKPLDGRTLVNTIQRCARAS